MVGGGIDDELKQPTFCVGLKGVKPEDIDKARGGSVCGGGGEGEVPEVRARYCVSCLPCHLRWHACTRVHARTHLPRRPPARPTNQPK